MGSLLAAAVIVTPAVLFAGAHDIAQRIARRFAPVHPAYVRKV